MKKTLPLLFFGVAGFLSLQAQQQVTVISRCGGVDTVTIPTITDNDLDGMDDALEQKLLNYFTPVFIKFDNESCHGPALDGSGDSNLVVSHIYPYPQQYSRSNRADSVLINPVALVPKGGLTIGLIWYKPLIKVNAALLYGKDCGLAGHTADVEGINYSLVYTGPDTLAGWMYDTLIQHWAGGAIQTRSHAGTLCEQIENKQGLDTIYISPDKHGNYLTIGGCGASFICNPGCGGIPSVKNVRPVNIGEPNASLIPDLGTAYAGYAGEDPWTTANFLASHSGNAGAIRDKMLLTLGSEFITGQRISSQADICGIYSQCFANSSTTALSTCQGSTYNFYGQALTQAGTYYHTLTGSHGCDSTIALALSIFPTSAYTYNTAICNGSSFNFNGRTLTTAGIYTDTLSNTNGCDSVVTLSLQVNPLNSYTYSAMVCSGQTFLFGNSPLTATGVYTDSLLNSNGCDSIVTLTLTVDTVPPVTWNFGFDTIAFDSHPILLTGTNPVGGTFTGPGVTGNLLYPNQAQPGINTITYTYTDNAGCSDSVSKTFTILTTGIQQLKANQFTVYPNPASNALTIKLPESAGTINIINAEGVLLKTQIATSSNLVLDISLLANGIYFVQFTGSTQSAVLKFAVQ